MRKKLLLLIIGIVIVAIASILILNLVNRCYYKAIFYEAHGLKKGSKVTMLGIPIGAVRNIELHEDSVIATFWIKNIRLKQGATLSLEPLNIFGDKELVLYTGQGDILPPYSTIYGTPKKGLRETIVSLGIFVDHLDSLIHEMIYLTSDAQRAFDETSQGLGKTISSVQQEAVRTLQDVREIATKTHGMMDKSTSALGATIENLRDVSASLKLLLETADTSFSIGLQALANTTARIDTLTALLVAGKGTAGKLLTSDTLYITIDSTLNSLKELLDDIKKNPAKYFKIF